MRAPPIGYRGRVVALTGYGQASDMTASIDAGFDAHLTKPVDHSQLLELIEKLSQLRTEQPTHWDAGPGELQPRYRKG
jgi:CheY-like chemotaxis protein